MDDEPATEPRLEVAALSGQWVRSQERAAGKRAALIIEANGTMTLSDTQGISVFRMEAPEPESEEVTRARLAWEAMQCRECGSRICSGAMFCQECRPYGLWHWLKYFSPIRWKRIYVGNGRG